MSTTSSAEQFAENFEKARAESNGDVETTEEVLDEEVENEDTPDTETEVDEDTEEEVEDSEEEQEEDEEEPLPEHVQKILRANRKDYRRIKAENEQLKADLEEAKKGIEPGETRYRDLYLQSTARTELIKAGATGDANKVLRLLDFDDIKIEDDGSITGLEEQIEELKEDFGQLFAKPTKHRKPAGKADGAGRRTSAPVQKDTAERFADMIPKK